MGSVSLSIFTSSSEPPIYSPTYNEWTPYEDPTIRAVISDEYFQNLNIWHVKVLLINYATIEMHQTDRAIVYVLADFFWNISKFGKINMIIYLLANRSSF
ncbi:hypothetical protein Gotur_022119 [Gossypium turneri]